MPVKTLKPPVKIKSNLSAGNGFPELTSLQAYNLVNALEHPQCGHVDRIYITADGYFFSPGNDLHQLVDLDPALPAEAALIKQGKKQKRVLLPGKYISRKPVIKEYTREEILDKKNEVAEAYTAELNAQRDKQKPEPGDNENPVKVITEALQKLTGTKKANN
jgi:hypothetical protein